MRPTPSYILAVGALLATAAADGIAERTNAAVILGALTLLWVVSVAVRDASIVDIAWGLTFVVTAWVTRFTADGDVARQNLLVILTSIWGLRLALYLARPSHDLLELGHHPLRHALACQVASH